MTTIAVPGPPEHFTDPTPDVGGKGDGDGDSIGDGGIGDWVGVGAGEV
jgi:hypothetical protein